MRKQLEYEALDSIARSLADIFAQHLIERLKPEISQLLSQRLGPVTAGFPNTVGQKKAHGSLWAINDLAKDSGLSPSTWRKWILQRKVPVVRLGRSVRIKDSDYRKMIEDSEVPELKPGRF